jgi:hypothetical protein
MKRVYLMLAVCAFAMASCKKNYTCDCTYNDGFGGTGSMTYTFEAKKADAEAVCEGYSVTAGGTGWSCDLK